MRSVTSFVAALAFLLCQLQLAAAQIPDGSYCGSVFGSTAEIFVTNNGFSLLLGGNAACSVRGTYSLSGSSVSFFPMESNCGSSLHVGSVVWSNGALTVSGTSALGGFSVQFTAAQCSALGILPSGVYCGAALGFTGSIVLLHTNFAFLVDGPNGCAVSGVYSTIPSSTTLSIAVTYSTCSAGLSLISASYTVTNGIYSLSFSGTASGQSFSTTVSSAQCSSGMAAGVYCGDALNTPASIHVMSNWFRFSLEGELSCSVTGTYNVTGSTVNYQVLLSTCSSITVSSVTYSNGAITVKGSAGPWDSLVNFTGVATMGTCGTDMVPNGLYCGRASGIRAENYVIGRMFRFVVGASIPCKIEGNYWFLNGVINVSVVSDTCNDLDITSITYANGIITMSGSSEFGPFTGTLSQSACVGYLVPDGFYCAASSSNSTTPSQVVIAGNSFSQDSSFLGYPCAAFGFYVVVTTPAGSTPSAVSTLISSSYCSSTSSTFAVTYTASSQTISVTTGGTTTAYSQANCIAPATYAIQTPTYKVDIVVYGYHYTWTYIPTSTSTATVAPGTNPAGSCVVTGTYTLDASGSATLYQNSGTSCIGAGLTSLAFHEGQVQFTATDSGTVIQGSAAAVNPPSQSETSSSHSGAIIGGVVAGVIVLGAIIAAKVYVGVKSTSGSPKASSSPMDNHDYLDKPLNDETASIPDTDGH